MYGPWLSGWLWALRCRELYRIWHTEYGAQNASRLRFHGSIFSSAVAARRQSADRRLYGCIDFPQMIFARDSSFGTKMWPTLGLISCDSCRSNHFRYHCCCWSGFAALVRGKRNNGTAALRTDGCYYTPLSQHPEFSARGNRRHNGHNTVLSPLRNTAAGDCWWRRTASHTNTKSRR